MSIAATNDIAIEYRDACKTYGPKTVLDHLSLKIPRGAFVTMIGTSGSGKTTALKMVNRLIEPTSGTVLVDGRDVRETDPIQLRRNIGYAIQGSVLFPHMTVEDNISYVPRLLNRNDHERTRKAVRTWMGIVGLSDDLLERYPSELSGGQQQRVGIARALVASPEVIFADEPTGNLDSRTSEEILSLIQRIACKDGHTLVMVTHDPTVAAHADRVVNILDGLIVDIVDQKAQRAADSAHSTEEETA